jgi:hypothetical protein
MTGSLPKVRACAGIPPPSLFFSHSRQSTDFAMVSYRISRRLLAKYYGIRGYGQNIPKEGVSGASAAVGAGRRNGFGCDAGISFVHTSRLAGPAVSVKVVRHIRAIYFCGKAVDRHPGILGDRIASLAANTDRPVKPKSDLRGLWFPPSENRGRWGSLCCGGAGRCRILRGPAPC